ncbi:MULTISPECIES: hypothetical protein [unclassified Pseudoxanthomonas]|uniref:hypothetical protein n=1 Tax=unclassified Pseudoxanthomonas TaxID=2645906 RepID=UPI0016155C72|nr:MULTISPECIES: hypothetical protein [unclassified Pseudoxanthomonas]MBB3277424.1 hypothetical protein [Pseudoxanthomonas sp. OG2]MBV7474097.1 hypothetical protein [Pseudoxanthomonas sp. PXM05]
MDIQATGLAILLLLASTPASASRPITDKDGMVCLSGQGLPVSTQEGDVTFQVNDMEVLPLNADSHLAVFVDVAAHHQAKFGNKGQQTQILEVDFKRTPNGSACLRYDPNSRLWSVTPSDRGNMCLDCAPDWVQQEPAHSSPSAHRK